MFEGAKLIDIGAVNGSTTQSLGFRLQLPDSRIISVAGLTIQECRKLSGMVGDVVDFSLTPGK